MAAFYRFSLALTGGCFWVHPVIQAEENRNGRPLQSVTTGGKGYAIWGTRAARIIALVDGDSLVLLSIVADRDMAYPDGVGLKS